MSKRLRHDSDDTPPRDRKIPNPSVDLFDTTNDDSSPITCAQSNLRVDSSPGDESFDLFISQKEEIDTGAPNVEIDRPVSPVAGPSTSDTPATSNITPGIEDPGSGDNFFSLSTKLATEEKAIKYCQTLGLLPTSAICNNCNCQVKKLEKICAKSQSWPQYRFQCNKNKCKKSGKNCIPLRKGSWFEASNLSITKSVLILYCFAKKFPYDLTAAETSVPNEFYGKGRKKTSSETICDYYNYCREVCIDDVEEQGVTRIGGPGTTVEIDEAKFGRRKYNRGRLVDGTWVFGGICRETRQFFLVPVDKRNAGTLLPLISSHIKEGSTIISDEWAAYRGIKDLGYKHLTVNHSKNFVDPESGGCTNLIENRWWCVKRQLPSTHSTRGKFGHHLSEYIWLSCVADKTRVFESLVKAIRRLYAF